MIKVINNKDLKYKHEIFVKEEPKIVTWFIYFALFVFCVVIIFCYFAKIEEVIHVQGRVRPTQNISIIKNIISGNVSEIKYINGKEVNAGDVLYTLNTELYAAQQEAIKKMYQSRIDDLENIELIIKSYKQNKNIIPREKKIAYYRFKVFENERLSLYNEYTRAETLLYEAEQLPENSIEQARLRELKFNRDKLYLNYLVYNDSFIQMINNEHEKLLLDKDMAFSQLQDINDQIEKHTIRAPISGYVLETSSINVGDYLASSQLVLQIVPTLEQLYTIELKILTKDSGKISENLNVKYRFTAFPFHEYGGATGKIISIDPDSFVSENGKTYYTAIASIDKKSLFDKLNNEYDIKSGLEVNARIILREQNILWYMLNILDFVG